MYLFEYCGVECSGTYPRPPMPRLTGINVAQTNVDCPVSVKEFVPAALVPAVNEAPEPNPAIVNPLLKSPVMLPLVAPENKTARVGVWLCERDGVLDGVGEVVGFAVPLGDADAVDVVDADGERVELADCELLGVCDADAVEVVDADGERVELADCEMLGVCDADTVVDALGVPVGDADNDTEGVLDGVWERDVDGVGVPVPVELDDGVRVADGVMDAVAEGVAAMHTSLMVQALPSSHGVPLGRSITWHAPELQKATVHWLSGTGQSVALAHDCAATHATSAREINNSRIARQRRNHKMSLDQFCILLIYVHGNHTTQGARVPLLAMWSYRLHCMGEGNGMDRRQSTVVVCSMRKGAASNRALPEMKKTPFFGT